MGLTREAIGVNAIDTGLHLKSGDTVIALAGNPNVGKSTVFNALTGMHQHTGNWPGKTVTNAQGRCVTQRHAYTVVDLPGTYSLLAHSAEEEVARNFICFGDPDIIVVVCDATCLERNLNLVLQAIEAGRNVVVCVNLLDEARRKHIRVDLDALQRELGVPVCGVCACKKNTLRQLTDTLDRVTETGCTTKPLRVLYPDAMEDALSLLEPILFEKFHDRPNRRWLALRLLERDASLQREICAYLGLDPMEDPALQAALIQAKNRLLQADIDSNDCKDQIVFALVRRAQAICQAAVSHWQSGYSPLDRKLDRLFTSRRTGYPVMLLLLALLLWLTITGANYPSQLLSTVLSWVQDRLTDLFMLLHAPQWLHDMLVLGAFRVLAWVVSVMLPPMAIFFPLFTLLEDAGYLPRVAFNLDRPLKRCHACGKQALTLW